VFQFPPLFPHVCVCALSAFCCCSLLVIAWPIWLAKCRSFLSVQFIFLSLLPHSPCAGIPSFSLLFRRVTFSQSPIFPFFVGGGWQQQQLDPPGPKGQKEGGAELFGQDFGRQRRSKRDGHSSRPSRPTRRRGQKDLPGANSFYSLCLRPMPFHDPPRQSNCPPSLPICCFCRTAAAISPNQFPFFPSRQICPPIALLFFNSNSPSFPPHSPNSFFQFAILSPKPNFSPSFLVLIWP
jgi:hypothetical protein